MELTVHGAAVLGRTAGSMGLGGEVAKGGDWPVSLLVPEPSAPSPESKISLDKT